MTAVLWLVLLGAMSIQTAASPPDAEPGSLDRYAQEDLDHAAIQDRVERLEAQLQAATRAYRHDLPSRDRTRFWWTPFDEPTRRAAQSTADRMRTLARTTTTQLLGDESNSAPRLRDRAALLAGLAEQLAAHADDPKTPIDVRLRDLHRRFGEAPAKLSRLDGPTLALMAAAAASAGDAAAAATLLDRSARDPLGLDAVELEFLRRCAERGGIDPRTRAETAIRMLDAGIEPADRMLLASMLMQARLDAGRPLGAVAGEVRRRLLPENGIESTVRVALLRTLADLIETRSREIVAIEDLHPLAALSRAGRRSASSTETETETDDATIEALLERAAASPVPSIRAEGLLELAARHADAGEDDAAAERLVAMVETLPSHPRAAKAASLAVRLAAYGDLDGFVRRLASALPEHPERHRWLLELGNRAWDAGDTEIARDGWLRIPEGTSERIQAVMLIARLDLETQRQQSWAEDLLLLEGLDLSTQSPATEIDRDLLRIEILLNLERDVDAERLAIELAERPDLDDAQVAPVATVVSAALEATGRAEEAIGFVLRLLDAHPGMSDQLMESIMERAASRTLMAFDADRLEDARELATMVLDRGPIDLEALASGAGTSPAALVGAAWLLATTGREEDARALVDLALTRAPDGLEPLFLRAVLRGGRLDGRRGIAADDARIALQDLARIAAGTSRGSTWWWRAEVERLEILVALGRDLVRVGDRIERWRRQFPSLGGSDFARRLRRLERTIAERDRSTND